LFKTTSIDFGVNTIKIDSLCTTEDKCHKTNSSIIALEKVVADNREAKNRSSLVLQSNIEDL